jgi:hypothetical protein
MDSMQNANPQTQNARPHAQAKAEHHGLGQPTLASKILVVLLIVSSVIFIVYMGLLAISRNSTNTVLKSKQYQAVFLTNGQVYFGKLSQVNNNWVKVTDIFYLQVQQAVQPGDKNANQQSQVSLAKLGNELHGPEDTMFVNRDQILFWENLKNDGKVVTAITDLKKNGSK